MLNGEDFFKDKNDDFSNSGNSPLNFDSPSDRVSMIEKVFEKVLGRKPTSRELAFYKYAITSEEEITEKLLEGDEHKKTLDDAKKLPNVEEQLRDTEADIKKLNQKVKDVADENIEQRKLLDEKNRIIEELREELKNPYNLPNDIERYEEGFDVYRKGIDVENKQETFGERVRDILDKILN